MIRHRAVKSSTIQPNPVNRSAKQSAKPQLPDGHQFEQAFAVPQALPPGAS